MGGKKNTAYCGVVTVVQGPSQSQSQSKSQGTSTHEMTYRNNSYDKQTGGYERVSAKQSFSSGDYSNRGKVGYKKEYKTSSTVRVGDQAGYTEYYKQERVTRVDYGSGSGSGGSKGYKQLGNGNKYY